MHMREAPQNNALERTRSAYFSSGGPAAQCSVTETRKRVSNPSLALVADAFQLVSSFYQHGMCRGEFLRSDHPDDIPIHR